MLFNQKQKETVDERLKLYEAQKTLEVDEKLSEYRRQEKNRSLEEVKSFQDSRIETITVRAKEEAEYMVKKLKAETELARLEGETVARKAVLETQESHRKLTAEARKENLEIKLQAVKDVADAKIEAAEDAAAKAEAEVDLLRSTITAFIAGGSKNTETLITALGSAAAKDHSTKVIGLGVNTESKS